MRLRELATSFQFHYRAKIINFVRPGIFWILNLIGFHDSLCHLRSKQMRSRRGSILPALKHGGYAAMSILPGENKAEFEKLHRDVIADLTPNGPLEADLVSTMARLLWRKQNLKTFQIAASARSLHDRVREETVPGFGYHLPEPKVKIDPVEQKEALQALEDVVREEFGEFYGLLQIGNAATIDGLMKELDVQDRLDAAIERCVNRLLKVRGLKSISSASSSAPPRQLPGPSKAA